MSQDMNIETQLTMGLAHIAHDYAAMCHIDPSLYGKMSDHGASIGGHARHILEFTQILAGSAKDGVVDYERRQRQKQFEHDPVAALEAFQQAMKDLERLLEVNGAAKALTVKEMPGFGLSQIAVPSSLGREVFYVIEHAIHHFALIKIIAQDWQCDLGNDFGVGIATRMHRSKQTAA